MKKNSVAKVFFISLLKSILFIVILIAVGLLSYKISYMVLSDDIGSIEASDGMIKSIIEDAQTDEISKNLIYVCNEDKITHIMLEICNTVTNNMDYITIPVRTDYTIPTTMYQKLCTVSEEIPQIVRLGRLKSYFSQEEDAYGYGELIIEKMLGIKISYYTVLNQETYDSHYTRARVRVKFKQSVDEATATPDASGVVPTTQDVIIRQYVSILSDAYINQIKDLGGDQEKIAEYIKEQYERVDSNLTVYNKIGYVECYEKLNVDLYRYRGIPGTYNNKIFTVDTKAAKTFLDKIINNTTSYTTPQNIKTSQTASSSGKNIKDSKKKNIIVLNGSRINGLASATKTRLETEGYTIGDIGDYTDETLTRTRIIVKKDGIGKDLIGYFNEPELVTGEVREGYDIEIILGTADAN